MMRTRKARAGNTTFEFAFLAASVTIPVIFGIIFLAQQLWIWHSINELTRDGARYAATHCWESGDNVVSYMRANVPVNIDQNQFTTGTASINVSYFSVDPSSGALDAFSCDTECSTSCVPDVVTVSVGDYQYAGFFSYLKLQPVTIPSFQISQPMEGAGCDPEQGVCNP